MAATQPDHEHPQYVTKADLEAFEGRFINRLAELETRLVRDINTAFWRQAGILLALLGLLATATFFVLSNLYAQTSALQAAIERLPR